MIMFIDTVIEPPSLPGSVSVGFVYSMNPGMALLAGPILDAM